MEFIILRRRRFVITANTGFTTEDLNRHIFHYDRELDCDY